jgi:VHL beta domain
MRAGCLLLVALSTGCLREARPYEDYLEDLARLPDAGTGTRDATVDAGPLCSQMSSFQAIDVTFSNRTGMNGDLIWIKADCMPMPFAMVDSNVDLTLGTFIGHVWRLEMRGSDQIIGGEVRIAANQTTVVFE